MTLCVDASCGRSLREKVIDVSRRLSKSPLSLQVRAGRGDSIAFGIENRDLITVEALVVKYKLVSVIAMCAGGGHLDLSNEARPRSAASLSTINAINGPSNGRQHKPLDDLHYTLSGTLIWTALPSSYNNCENRVTLWCGA